MIKTFSKNNCPVCQSPGESKYRELQDILSHTTGDWSMDYCTNKECMTYWLNPAPQSDELINLYTDYTTHKKPDNRKATISKNPLRRLSRLASQAVLTELNYQNNNSRYINYIFRYLSYIHPGWRNSQKDQVMYVPFVENGHFLDVGCGSGGAMLSLQKRGWKVTGTDFDSKALEAARQNNLEVYEGELKALDFPENHFDAILLSHVIEHVPDPVALISECRRILKSGGHLIVITPNANSSSHTKFQQCWRGLEVPRHLQVFTPYSLGLVAKNAGFLNFSSSTCMQGFLYLKEASKACRKNNDYELIPKGHFGRVLDKCRLYFAGILFVFSPGKEETNLLHCVKD